MNHPASFVCDIPALAVAGKSQFSQSEKEIMNRALLARVEYLEAENLKLKEEVSYARLKHFRL